MKIALVNYFYDENIDNEESLIRQYYTLTGWAESLQQQGAEVTVITRFSRNNQLEKNGVRYFFVRDGLGPRFSALEFPLKFLKAVAVLDADIVHLHHFTLSLQTRLLRFLLNKKKGHHHSASRWQGAPRMEDKIAQPYQQRSGRLFFYGLRTGLRLVS